MTIEYKIRFLEDCRSHPEKYLPLISHAWRQFPSREKNTYDPEYNVGWDAGILEGNRPYFAECWATSGITMLTYFVSTEGMEGRSREELLGMLEAAGLVRVKDMTKPRTEVVVIQDDGRPFYSINIVVGIEDETYTEGGMIYGFSRLNEYNRAREEGKGDKDD